MHSKYFNGKLWPYHFSWSINSIFICPSLYYWMNFELEAFSYNFKINCMLVWQLMSLNKKMFGSSGKLNIIFMVSYLYSFNPRVSINENCNPLAVPIYSNTESGNSRWFCPIRVQELDRRSFILILDWILV